MSFNEWKEYKLGEVYEFSSGLSKSRKEFGYGYEFLTFKDVFYNYSLPEELSELVNSTEKERENCSIKRGDVFLTRTSETLEELGMSSVALKDYKDATFNGFTKRLRPKGNVHILPEYVAYYFRSSGFRREITCMSSMTTRASLNNDMLSILKLVVPPLNEQRKIAKILSDIDRKIETNNQINKKLEEMAQAIFQLWFVDFEFPNEDGDSYKSSGGEMIHSEMGMIPKGWEAKQLKEFIKFEKGKKPKIINKNSFENSKIYLTIDVLNRNSLQYAINEKVVLTEKKDILMVMDGASSGTLYYGMHGIVGSTLAKISINNQFVNTDILCYFLKTNESDIKMHLTGSAIPHTDKEYINRLYMAIPREKKLFEKTTKLLSDIRTKIININEESYVLRNIRDSLLPKLMSGEIRVPLD